MAHTHPAYECPGFGAAYHRARPGPPRALLDVLCDLLGGRPELVVDLGSGTGLSTAAWSGLAVRAIGIESNPEMLGAAPAADGVEYRRAEATATGLPDGCADVVTCSQSFHWMDAEPALAEVARILRPGGVFAAYDYELPPAIEPAVDAAFAAALTLDLVEPGAWRAQKLRELESVRASGVFAYSREVFVHGRDVWDADRVVDFALSLGQVSRRLVEGETEEQVGIGRLREALAGRRLPVWWSYDVVVGSRA